MQGDNCIPPLQVQEQEQERNRTLSCTISALFPCNNTCRGLSVRSPDMNGHGSPAAAGHAGKHPSRKNMTEEAPQVVVVVQKLLFHKQHAGHPGGSQLGGGQLGGGQTGGDQGSSGQDDGVSEAGAWVHLGNASGFFHHGLTADEA